MVLLKNEGVLPLHGSQSVAVVGPHAFSTRDLLSDYPIDQLCFQEPKRSGDCWPTLGEAFAALHPGNVTVEKGVDMDSKEPPGIAAALAAANRSDMVVLCLGIGNHQE